MKSHRYLISKTIYTALFLCYIIISKQGVSQNSEDYKYSEYLKSIEEKINTTKNISIGIDYQLTNNYAVISGTFFNVINSTYLRAVPTVRGFFPLVNKLSLIVNAPYIVNAQMLSIPQSLPGLVHEEFDVQTGIGDIITGLKWWDNKNYIKSEINFQSSLNLVIPTGKSVFTDTSNTFTPRGGGFWGISFEGSFSKYFSNNFVINFDMSILTRIKTQYSDPSSSSLQKSYSYATGEPVLIAGLSLGIPVGKTNAQSLLSLVYSETYIGKTYTLKDNISKQKSGSYSLRRLGINGESNFMSIFIGAQFTTDYEKQNSNTTFVYEARIPLGFNKIGLKF